MRPAWMKRGLLGLARADASASSSSPSLCPTVQDNRVGELACEQFGLRGRPEDCGPEAATLCVVRAVRSQHTPQSFLSARACVWCLFFVLKYGQALKGS
jgi:hypothetical protein